MIRNSDGQGTHINGRETCPSGRGEISQRGVEFAQCGSIKSMERGKGGGKGKKFWVGTF